MHLIIAIDDCLQVTRQRLARHGCLVADVASVIGAGCAVELQLRGAAYSTA